MFSWTFLMFFSTYLATFFQWISQNIPSHTVSNEGFKIWKSPVPSICNAILVVTIIVEGWSQV